MTINLLVAALHVVNLRALLPPSFGSFIGSYFSDLTIPFAFYFLLCFVDDRLHHLQPATAKAGLVFIGASASELLQGVGLPVLGRTFDPWDFGMYAAGVGAAAALDRFVLTPLVPKWSL